MAGRVGRLLLASLFVTACSFPVDDLRVDDAGAVDDAVACESPSTFHLDSDGDGFGAGEGVVACTAPPNHVGNALDCRDDDARANPAALDYRTEGYDVGASVPSFDWNCDGKEDPDPALPLSSEPCAFAGGASTDCVGEGYLPVAERSVPSVNAWCGSTSYRACTKQTSPPRCVETIETRAPVGCR